MIPSLEDRLAMCGMAECYWCGAWRDDLRENKQCRSAESDPRTVNRLCEVVRRIGAEAKAIS